MLPTALTRNSQHSQNQEHYGVECYLHLPVTHRTPPAPEREREA